MSGLDFIATVWLALLGTVTFIAFGYDKRGAGHSRRRVPERVLVLLAAFGGWPGGLLGMMVFRHKTAKSTFKLKYALALLPFAAGVWAWWHWRNHGAMSGCSTPPIQYSITSLRLMCDILNTSIVLVLNRN